MASKGGGGGHSPRLLRPVLDVPTPLTAIPSMNALEILRETVRILRRDCGPFLSTLAFLICPVSTAVLSDAFVSRVITRALSLRLMLIASSSGLPLTHFIKQMCHYFAGTVLSSASCYPLLITFLLLAKASVAYSVACSYAGKEVVATEFFTLVWGIWRRLVLTYLWVCGAISICLALFITILVVVCSSFTAIGYPPEVVVYPALLTVLAFSVVYAHTIIVCNLASVISVLEERSGLEAFLRSVYLIKGQTQAGLLIFLGSAIGMAFVEGLFEHRVKTLSYGDGSSRIWEGPLLVIMYSFVVLVDSMMSAVFYFTCRSSSLEELNGMGDLPEEMKMFPPSTVDVE